MTNLLQNCPNDIVRALCEEWVTLKELAKVDTAFCLTIERSWFLGLMNQMTKSDRYDERRKSNHYKWVLLRGFCLKTIVVGRSNIKEILKFPSITNCVEDLSIHHDTFKSFKSLNQCVTKIVNQSFQLKVLTMMTLKFFTDDDLGALCPKILSQLTSLTVKWRYSGAFNFEIIALHCRNLEWLDVSDIDPDMLSQILTKNIKLTDLTIDGSDIFTSDDDNVITTNIASILHILASKNRDQVKRLEIGYYESPTQNMVHAIKTFLQNQKSLCHFYLFNIMELCCIPNSNKKQLCLYQGLLKHDFVKGTMVEIIGAIPDVAVFRIYSSDEFATHTVLQTAAKCYTNSLIECSFEFEWITSSPLLFEIFTEFITKCTALKRIDFLANSSGYYNLCAPSYVRSLNENFPNIVMKYVFAQDGM